jgi:hypothetical protein
VGTGWGTNLYPLPLAMAKPSSVDIQTMHKPQYHVTFE